MATSIKMGHISVSNNRAASRTLPLFFIAPDFSRMATIRARMVKPWVFHVIV
jgi:hypothetical protein